MEELEYLLETEDTYSIGLYILNHNTIETFQFLDQHRYKYSLEHVPNDIYNNLEYLKRSLKINDDLPEIVFDYDALYQEKDFLLKVLNKHPKLYRKIKVDQYKIDYDVCIATFRFAQALEMADERVYDDEKIMFELFLRDLNSFKFFSKRLLDDEEFMMKCFEHIDHRFNCEIPQKYHTLEIAKMLVKRSGILIRLFPELIDNDELNILALNSNPAAIRFCSKKFKSDIEVAKKVIKENPSLLFDFSFEIKNNKELLLEVLSRNAILINEVTRPLLDDPDILIATYKSACRSYSTPVNENVILFLQKFSKGLYDEHLMINLTERYRNFFSLPKEEFIKLLSVFTEENITIHENDLNNLLHLVSNQLYLQENNEKIYTTLIRLLKSKVDITDYLSRLFPDVTFNIELLKKNDPNEIEKLHHECASYEEKKKGQYAREHHDELLDHINYNNAAYDKKSLITYIFANFTFDIIYPLINIDDEFDYDETKLVYDTFQNEKKIINKEIFNKILHKIYYLNENGKLDELIRSYIPRSRVIKPDTKFILQIFLSSNYHINVNDELMEFLKKTKILGYGSYFHRLFNLIDLDFDEDTICSILMNYEELKDSNVLKVIDHACHNNELENKLKLLIGEDVYNYFKRNEGLYKGTYSTRKRIAYLPSLIKKLISKKPLTVPSIKKRYLIRYDTIDMEIDNHSPYNLCLGEIVNCCTRLGADASDLYLRTLDDNNFFNIIIRSKDKIIGKVTGFRAGNNIILNQVRSVNSNYNNQIVEAMYLFAHDLVNASDPEEPIENVVCSSEFVMEHEPTTCISELSTYCNLREREYYYDFTNNKCVLLSENSPVKVRHYVPTITFSPKVQFNRTNDPRVIYQKINQFYLQKHLLEDKDIMDYKLIDTSNINSLIFGEGFIIYDGNYYTLFEDSELINRINMFLQNKRFIK